MSKSRDKSSKKTVHHCAKRVHNELSRDDEDIVVVEPSVKAPKGAELEAHELVYLRSTPVGTPEDSAATPPPCVTIKPAGVTVVRTESSLQKAGPAHSKVHETPQINSPDVKALDRSTVLRNFKRYVSTDIIKFA